MENRMAQSQPQPSGPPTGQKAIKSGSADEPTNGISTDKSGAEKSGTDTEKTAGATRSDNDPIEMLKADHRHVEQLFAAFEKAKDEQDKLRLVRQVCSELM